MNQQQKLTAQAIVNVFETGRVMGNYSAVTVLPGDSGHLTYGRSQTTLGSGNLFQLLNDYCRQPGALFAAQLAPSLPRFQQKDISLDTDASIRALLQQAGTDPVMRATQDQFFDANYFIPSVTAAGNVGITEPLGVTVVYDSHIQGGWGTLLKRMPSVSDAGGERAWVASYVSLRRSWLLSLDPPLPSTVYRMDSFNALIAQNKWDLALPLTVHGVTITADTLAGAPRTLRLTTPFMRGDDVKALQQALGLGAAADGVYGPQTDSLVKQRQAAADPPIVEDGVGPLTRQLLGLSDSAASA
jgi:chitosanase